jgi:hypothetical protein
MNFVQVYILTYIKLAIFLDCPSLMENFWVEEHVTCHQKLKIKISAFLPPTGSFCHASAKHIAHVVLRSDSEIRQG